MTHASQTTVTRLLQEMQGGNQAVLNTLFSLVYEELHTRAHQQRVHWHGDYTLNTTALVHEAYLKLVDQSKAQWESRAHFMSVAAKAMRHILVDYARGRRAEKRGGDVQKLSLEEMKVALEKGDISSEESDNALLVLDKALEQLEQIGGREAQVVECRFFGGMTVKETAAALSLSPTTVKRDWAKARAWLLWEMQMHLER